MAALEKLPPRDGDISEDVARKLIARAIELDAGSADNVAISQLRDVAHEAGISAGAFDQALREAKALATAHPPKADRSRWDEFEVNAGILGASWVIMVLLVLAGEFTKGWVAPAVGMLTGSLIGLAIARRFNAGPALFILKGFAVSRVTELALHLIFGISAVQGAPTHWAVLLASFLGVGISEMGRRRGDDIPARASPAPKAPASAAAA